ncbi:MAG: Gfo/Idh/MocA family protein [Bacteroidota bacterium]
MKATNRREFLKTTTTTATGLILSVPVVKSGFSNKSPNDIINVAVVGIRGKGGIYGGGGHYLNYCKMPNVRVTTLCDIDERLFPEAVKNVEKFGGNTPKTVVDFRDLLDDKDIDVISIATPDHWHALQTIWACQAGKDVYVEKPISYNIDEGRKMVQAARKYGRIVQTGTQRRSNPVTTEAIKFIHDGKLGDIYMGRGIVYGHRGNIGHVKDSPIPEGVNWDLFLGPAPYRPFNKNRFHYNWHWFWDTSTSEFGNNGTHSMDLIRWGMNKRVHPVKVHSTGGFYGWDSNQEIPNLQVATYEYDDGTIMELEVRSLYTNPEFGGKSGSFFYGTEGWMYLGGGEFKTFFGTKDEPGPSMSDSDVEMPVLKNIADAETDDSVKVRDLEYAHFSNFIDCVRSRKWQDLNADISEGHMSTAFAHLGNISYRTGRKLTFNSHAEKFINDEDANSYLTRNYRFPYVVPEKV